jgi:hypothetical protein
MAIGPNRDQRTVEVGEGNRNWPALLKEAREGGVEWYLVERSSRPETALAWRRPKAFSGVSRALHSAGG